MQFLHKNQIFNKGFVKLPERGSSNIHFQTNVNKCLDTLRKNDVEFVNIQAEKLVSGNEKITLGIVWTILHHFQVFISIAAFQKLSGQPNADSRLRSSPGPCFGLQRIIVKHKVKLTSKKLSCEPLTTD